MKQKSTYTAGPWKLVKTAKGWFIKTKDGCVVGGINRFPDGAGMASQCEPNAKLAVAAPDLVEGLKASRAILFSILGEDANSPIIAEQIALINASLAKAGVEP